MARRGRRGRVLSRLFDWLAPPTCAACALPVASLRAFCPACAITIQRHDHSRAPLDAQVAFFYGGALVTAITRWKFEAALGVGSRLVELCTSELAATLPSRALFVPVPLHPRRLAERGFNPAALLARSLAQRTGGEFRHDLVHRVRDTPKQSQLARAERTRNVEGAFVAPRAAERPVVLVDDVCTTGATLRACQAALVLRGTRAPIQAAVLALASRNGSAPSS